MNIEIGYWLFQKKLPHHICDDIIKYGLSQKESIAWVGEEEIQPENKEAVEKFYEIAISKGATDEGAPGVRKDGNYYGYIRDLDGNKIAAKSVLK